MTDQSTAGGVEDHADQAHQTADEPISSQTGEATAGTSFLNLSTELRWKILDLAMPVPTLRRDVWLVVATTPGLRVDLIDDCFIEGHRKQVRREAKVLRKTFLRKPKAHRTYDPISPSLSKHEKDALTSIRNLRLSCRQVLTDLNNSSIVENWLKTGLPLTLYWLNHNMNTPKLEFYRVKTVTLQSYMPTFLEEEYEEHEEKDLPQIISDEHCCIDIIDRQADAVRQRGPTIPVRRIAGYWDLKSSLKPWQGNDKWSEKFVGSLHDLHMQWLRAAYELGSHIKRVVVHIDVEECLLNSAHQGWIRNGGDFIQWRDLIEVIRVLRHGGSTTSSHSRVTFQTGIAREVHIVGHSILEELNDVDLSSGADTVLPMKIIEKLNRSIARMKRADWWNDDLNSSSSYRDLRFGNSR